jgi:hypothetical protein
MLRESEAFTQSKDPMPADASIGPARRFCHRPERPLPAVSLFTLYF